MCVCVCVAHACGYVCVSVQDRSELYQLMQDTAHACRTKPSTFAQGDGASQMGSSQMGASQMGGGASFIGGGPSVLGSGPSSLGGGHGSFIGGPGIHAYQHFTPHRGPQSSDPMHGPPPVSPLRSGDSRMEGVSPVGKTSVAFGRTARTRSTSTPGAANRSPHAHRGAARDGGTPPSVSRSPQPRSRTPVSRYSPPTSLRAIRTSAEAPTDRGQPEGMAAAAAAQVRRASASGVTHASRANSTSAADGLDRIVAKLDGRAGAPKSPPAWASPEARGAGAAGAAGPAAAAVDLAPLEKKVSDVQTALRHAKASLSEIQAGRDAEKQQMGDFGKSIARVSERLDGIDSAVRTVASATAEAAEAAANGRKEGVMELRELKGHVESMWKDVSGLKEWQRDAEGQQQGLQSRMRQTARAADAAAEKADAARTAAASAAAAAAAASDTADAVAADVARQREAAAASEAAAAAAPRSGSAATPQREASMLAERDSRAIDADMAAEAAAIAAEAATADAAAKAAEAAAAKGAAEAVAVVSKEMSELRAAMSNVQTLRWPGLETVRGDVEELREFHASAKLKFVELDDAIERLEEARADRGVTARILESTPKHSIGGVVPEEVADRLDEVWRKVGALESQVAGWSKAHGDGDGAHGGSGASASPPRTPEAYGNYPEEMCAPAAADAPDAAARSCRPGGGGARSVAQTCMHPSPCRCFLLAVCLGQGAACDPACCCRASRQTGCDGRGRDALVNAGHACATERCPPPPHAWHACMRLSASWRESRRIVSCSAVATHAGMRPRV